MDRDNQAGSAANDDQTDPENNDLTGFAPGAASGGALDDTTSASVGSAAMGGLGSARSVGGSAENDMSGAAMGSGGAGSALDTMGNRPLESQRGHATPDGVSGQPAPGTATDQRPAGSVEERDAQ